MLYTEIRHMDEQCRKIHSTKTMGEHLHLASLCQIPH